MGKDVILASILGCVTHPENDSLISLDRQNLIAEYFTSHFKGYKNQSFVLFPTKSLYALSVFVVEGGQRRQKFIGIQIRNRRWMQTEMRRDGEESGRHELEVVRRLAANI